MQSFYAEQGIHNDARDSRSVYEALNRNAASWKITSRALQANALIVIGRISDKDSRTHGIRRLLNLAANHHEILSEAALEKRKRPQAGQWTDELMRTAYLRTKRDFSCFQAHAETQRAI